MLLILSAPGDTHAVAVERILTRRRVPFIHWNQADFPADDELTLRYDAGGLRTRTLVRGGERIDFSNVKQATGGTTLSNITIPTVTTVTTANINLSQAIPTSNTAQTVGDSLNAARAQGFGKWVLSGTTLTLFAPDNSTPVRTFTLDNATAPTQRS